MKNPGGKHRGAGSPRLSAHEMAALMLLGYAPVKLEVEDPDMIALQDAGLARRTEYDPGWQEFSITNEGRDMLRALDALNAPEDVTERLADRG